MSESRDANDPRDLMRAMRKEAEADFEREEEEDTGGQEHASREDRDGVPARPPVTGGGQRTTRGPPPGIGDEPKEK